MLIIFSEMTLIKYKFKRILTPKMFIWLCEWKYLRFILLAIAFQLIFCLTLWKLLDSNRAIKNWNTVKPTIDKMKKDMMKTYSLTEDEYMQCMIGVWIVSIIEPDDIKRLMRLQEGTEKEKKATKKTITLIKDDQKSMRIFFLVDDDAIKKVWGGRYLSSVIELLKEEPSNTLLDETERNVVDAFYEKYKKIENTLKGKVMFGKLTFVENAIKRVPEIFKDCVFKFTD